jgi:hypothetical protein
MPSRASSGRGPRAVRRCTICHSRRHRGSQKKLLLPQLLPAAAAAVAAAAKGGRLGLAALEGRASLASFPLLHCSSMHAATGVLLRWRAGLAGGRCRFCPPPPSLSLLVLRSRRRGLPAGLSLGLLPLPLLLLRSRARLCEWASSFTRRVCRAA